MTTCEHQPTEMRVALGAQQPHLARDNSVGPDVGATLRRTLWSAVVRELNHSKLPYCVLGARAEAIERNQSDMDFVVRPGDYPFVPHLLAAAAASAGAQLVQAIDHETTATYFVLAKQQGEMVAFLHPDCTTDYRRQRRLWMSAEELLRGRRRAPGGYFHPTADVEFKYYLVKQVLKQTLSDAQWQQLVALYQASPLPHNALSLWRRSTAAQIEQALLKPDRDGFRKLLPHVKHELTNTSPREGTLPRGGSFLLDCARMVTRITQPTGLFVQITNGGLGERTELACRLAKALAPAFRRSSLVATSNPAGMLRALVESTLVVSSDEVAPFRTFYGGVDVDWRPALSPQKNLELAIAAVLSHLAHRTMLRLELQNSQTLEPRDLARTTIY